MARKKKVKPEETPAETEQRMTEAHHAEVEKHLPPEPPAEPPAPPADPAPKPAEPEALRSVEGVYLPGVKARFIDDMHAVGVKFDFDDKNERPSKEVTAVLKEDGFGWKPEKQQWRKRISRENPIADRHDAQESFAEAVRRLEKDREGRGR